MPLRWSAAVVPIRSLLAAFVLAQDATPPQPRSPVEHFLARREAIEWEGRGLLPQAGELYAELFDENTQDASLALRAGSCFRGARLHERALPLLVRAFEAGADARYELAYEIAQANAALGRSTEALDWLERALAERYVDRPAIATDPAFASLRGDARFAAIAGLLPEREFDRSSGWSYDLDFYRSEVRRLHVGPGRPGERPEFRAAVEDLRARVPELSNERIAFELQKITARLGDGHSLVYPLPTPRVGFAAAPVALRFFADGLFVISGRDGVVDLAGAQVVSIGGHGLPEIEAALATIVSRDNDSGIRWVGPAFLTHPAAVHALGLTPDAGSIPFELRMPDGAERRAAIGPMPARVGSHGGIPKIGPPPGTPPDSAPLWLRLPDEPFWHEELPDDDALYVQINQVQDAGTKTLERFAGEVRELLVETGFHALVLDLRRNNGGNNFLVWPVVRLAAWFQESDPGHRIFVLTGPNTFSAAQNLLNQLCRATDAIVAGEPSSSKPCFAGESTEVLLPWSGLRLSISSRWWQDSFPEDARPWIAPDLPVALTSRDWLENRDPVLDAVRELLLHDF